MVKRALTITTITLLLFCCSGIGVLAAPPLQPPQTRQKQQRQTGGSAALSITPTQAEPGARAVISMNSSIHGARLYLGGTELTAEKLDGSKLAFIVPDIPPGLYALGLLFSDNTSRSYSFTVLPQRPVTLKIEPDQVTGCSLNEAVEATVYGRHFTETTQLLFDGAIIASRYQSSEAIRFRIPRVTGGLHQVTVRSNNENATPLALSILTQPEINTVSTGTDRVTSYDLIIEGSNFQQGSQLLVDGLRVDSSGTSPTGQITSIDCNRMVYQRKPFSSTPRPLKLQVVNPGGETSSAYLMITP